MSIVHCYPPLALSSSLGSRPHSPSSTLPRPPLLASLLPVTALTAWLLVRAEAFCGSVTNLPGKTETICSDRCLRGDAGVTKRVYPSASARPALAAPPSPAPDSPLPLGLNLHPHLQLNGDLQSLPGSPVSAYIWNIRWLTPQSVTCCSSTEFSS